jgi:type III secretion protein Q
VELARVELTVAQLASLRAGEVLTTGTMVGTQVALRAGDRVVARGELVDVEGELGVRILELG